jgi:hypothetical protein
MPAADLDLTPVRQWACLPRSGPAQPAGAPAPPGSAADRVQESHTATIRARLRAGRESNPQPSDPKSDALSS